MPNLIMRRRSAYYKQRAANYGLTVETIGVLLDMTASDVAHCLTGANEIPMRLRSFFALLATAGSKTRASLLSVAGDVKPLANWRSIAGFWNYEVSDIGTVRRNGRELKPVRMPSGHLKVTLYNGTKRGLTFSIHVLVARTFIGEPPPGKMNVCHLNGIPTDNRVANLYWGSTAENVADRMRHARFRRSEKSMRNVAHHV